MDQELLINPYGYQARTIAVCFKRKYSPDFTGADFTGRDLTGRDLTGIEKP